MSFSVTFFLNGGLFDFDITFLGEGILFLLFSFVVTFVFLAPISDQLDERAEHINFNLRKSNFLVGVAVKKVSNAVKVLKSEIVELNRQMKLTKDFTNQNFEEEINFVQTENGLLLSRLKGELSIKSGLLLSDISDELITLTDAFFVKKFQSNS